MGADAFGNALGSSITDTMQDNEVESKRPTGAAEVSPSHTWSMSSTNVQLDTLDAVGVGGYNSDMARELGLVATDAGAELGEGPYASASTAIRSDNTSRLETMIGKASENLGWIEKGAEQLLGYLDGSEPKGWWKKASDWQVENPEKVGETIRLGDLESDRHNGEMLALKDYLSQVPEYMAVNETTMASVIKGFPEYFDRHMSLQIASASAGVAKDTWLFGAGAGGKILELAELGIDANSLPSDAADLGRLVAEQYSKSPARAQLDGLHSGPQIFNQELFESIFGKPAKGWDSYPAWNIPSNTTRK